MMKLCKGLFVIFFLTILSGCRESVNNAGMLTWPEASNQTRPWTRWWWHGSAVTKQGITDDLESIKDSGIGGVELTPIFGVVGEESQFVPYLSEDWMELFVHTLLEARRLGLGVDMATGTGWPFGGPWVGESDAPKNFSFRKYKLNQGERLSGPVKFVQEPLLRAIRNPVYKLFKHHQVSPGMIPGLMKNKEALDTIKWAGIEDIISPVSANNDLQGLALDQVRFKRELPVAGLTGFHPSGKKVDLLDKLSEAGELEWAAPTDNWTVYALFQGWHGKMVERAAPGGEGNTLDHFSERAVQAYLSRFDSAFSGKDIGYLRAFFNDSYEVDDASGEADWTPRFFEEFEHKRGYDLREYLPELLETGLDNHTRVLSDYRETLGELLLERFTQNWDRWAEKHGALIRNQAHGSPGNILDLYAASDIPETEGTDLLSIQLASSAAHVTGKNLVSAEAATWLNEHFKSTLSDIKANLDRYFLGGINHVFYHGTAYSPKEEAWPGHLFYAAIHANSRNTWWHDFPKLNNYAARVQSFLQAGEPANDVLLYLPIYDLYASEGHGRLMHFHLGRGEFQSSGVRKWALWLRENGYSFDYVSDAQLQDIYPDESKLKINDNASYTTLVVPPCSFMPEETLAQILKLAKKGGEVIFLDSLPKGPNGYFNYEKRSERFDDLKSQLIGEQSVRVGISPEAMLQDSRALKEEMTEMGLQYIRRKHESGHYYFIVNQGEKKVDGYVPIGVSSKSTVLFNPLTGEAGGARVSENGEVYLQLSVGESIIVAIYEAGVDVSDYYYYDYKGAETKLEGIWKVRFVSGGPTLPAEKVKDKLDSWTNWEGDVSKAFSGTALYAITFPKPKELEGQIKLNLGDVKETARVILNGQVVDTLIGPDYSVVIPDSLFKEDNVLEVYVTNLMANRMANMDKKGTFWKKFYNVNFPASKSENRVNGLFDASGWSAVPSGLLGPVTLSEVRNKKF